MLILRQVMDTATNNYSVLICEDEESLRLALKHKLSQSDYQVLEAENGKIGLDLALKTKPDIILLDIVMPVVNGLEFLKELRADSWGSKAKIFILTNVSDSSLIPKAMQYNVHNFFIKSDVKLDELIQAIDNELKTR